MKIRIFQINTDRDLDHVKYRSSKWLKEHDGYRSPDPSIYDKVFEGEVNAETLEDVFAMFNFDPIPADFTGHSLSMSDVVAVDVSTTITPGYYYCDTIGFTPVTF